MKTELIKTLDYSIEKADKERDLLHKPDGAFEGDATIYGDGSNR